MLYKGTKFRTEFYSQDIPRSLRVEELKKWCQEFDRLGFAPSYGKGSFGNLSYRVRNGADEFNEFIITGSNVGFSDGLVDDCFVKVMSVDLEKRIVGVSGIIEPSSESILHHAIYKQRKDVNAIFHGHSQDVMSKALQLGFQETKEEKPYGTIELTEQVLNILDDHRFIIMKNHGFISLAETMLEAGEYVKRLS